MKRRTALTSLAILITPLALGVPTAHASGDDEHDDELEHDLKAPMPAHRSPTDER